MNAFIGPAFNGVLRPIKVNTAHEQDYKRLSCPSLLTPGFYLAKCFYLTRRPLQYLPKRTYTAVAWLLLGCARTTSRGA